MAGYRDAGRLFQKRIKVLTKELDGGERLILAPAPGYWRDAPAPGTHLHSGEGLGRLEVLGERYLLEADEQVTGQVLERDHAASGARSAVEFGQLLCVLAPATAAQTQASSDTEAAAKTDSGPVFRSPMSGRYYSRPAPDAEPFVRVGDLLEGGETIALLEVMKTFSRIRYEKGGNSASMRIKAIHPAEGSDLEKGDIILEFES